MMKRLRFLPKASSLLALVMVLSWVLAACAPTAPAQPGAPSPASEPAATAGEATAPTTEEGGTGEGSLLRFGYSQRPNNFNPLDVVQGIEGFTQKWTNAKLVTLDRNGQLMGDLAESWSVSEDGTVFDFKLRNGVKWQMMYSLPSSAS
jgi:ABC-type transport system substrate-binding protein